jgi:hypothetical protein
VNGRTKTTSPWVKRAQAEAERTGHVSRVQPSADLGDRIIADIRLDDRERELQDAYILGQALAAARARENA